MTYEVHDRVKLTHHLTLSVNNDAQSFLKDQTGTIRDFNIFPVGIDDFARTAIIVDLDDGRQVWLRPNEITHA